MVKRLHHGCGRLSEPKTVTLGVATYGGHDLLRTCLTSIAKSVRDAGFSNFEVVVVDDGSPDPAPIQSLCEAYQTKHIRCHEQRGNVARYNTVVEESKGDIIYLIDNDILLPDRWFTSALHFLTSNKCGVASFLSQKVTDEQVEELLAKPRITAVGTGRTPERATELAGYCYGFLRENWELVGGFDDRNFKYFMGDSDFCCKLAEMGLMSYRVLYPVVYHREHTTYNAYPELQAWKRVDEDLANFKRKWSCTPKEVEQRFLAQIKPQVINWYANYAVHVDWDDESMKGAEAPFVRTMPFERVLEKYRGQASDSEG